MVKKDTGNRLKYIELSDQDLFCFRSKACRRYDTPKGCEFGKNKCQYSHQPKCIRRCPIYLSDVTKLRYLPLKCPDMQFESSHEECPRTKLCPYAHSQEEIDFHPLNYQKERCEQTSCPKLYCPKSHGHHKKTSKTDPVYTLPFSRGCDIPEVKNVIYTDPEYLQTITKDPRKEILKFKADRQDTPITPSGSTPTVSSTITPSVLGGPSPLLAHNNSYLMPFDLLSPTMNLNGQNMLSPLMFNQTPSGILHKSNMFHHKPMSSSPSNIPATPTDLMTESNYWPHQYSAKALSAASLLRSPLDKQSILKEGQELMEMLNALQSDSTKMGDVQAALLASNRIHNLLLGKSLGLQENTPLQKH